MTEMDLVSQTENVSRTLPPTNMVDTILPDVVSGITLEIETLRRRTQESADDLQKMEQELNASTIAYYDYSSLTNRLQLSMAAGNPQTPESLEAEMQMRRQKEHQEQVLNHKFSTLLHLRLTLADNLKDTISKLNDVCCKVLDDELLRYL